MELTKARNIATGVIEQLRPYSLKIGIAGSIRRERTEVKDIEIVCLPAYRAEDLIDLFGGQSTLTLVSIDFVKAINNAGTVIKGKPDGRYMQVGLPQGILMDLFLPAPDDYFRQLAIRTGSREYVINNIAAAWNRLGWCGSDQGLRLKKDCKEIREHPSCKPIWKCLNPSAEKPPVWQTEGEFFQWLRVPCVMPKLRTI